MKTCSAINNKKGQKHFTSLKEKKSNNKTEVRSTYERETPKLSDKSVSQPKKDWKALAKETGGIWEIDTPYSDLGGNNSIDYYLPDELSKKLFELIASDDVLKPILAKLRCEKFSISLSWD